MPRKLHVELTGLGLLSCKHSEMAPGFSSPANEMFISYSTVHYARDTRVPLAAMSFCLSANPATALFACAFPPTRTSAYMYKLTFVCTNGCNAGDLKTFSHELLCLLTTVPPQACIGARRDPCDLWRGDRLSNACNEFKLSERVLNTSTGGAWFR